MNYSKARKTWEDTDSRNKLLIVSNIGMVFLCGMMFTKIMSTHEIVTMQPPALQGIAKIGVDSANAEYKKSWAIYVATLVGNVTPNNVSFISDTLSGMLDSKIYPKIRTQIAAMAKDPVFANNSTSLVFEPRSVVYEPKTDKVFVSGDLYSLSAGGRTINRRMVYEMIVSIKDYRPVITHLDTYEGHPRTEKWINDRTKNPKDSDAFAAAEKERAEEAEAFVESANNGSAIAEPVEVAKEEIQQ